ncbi:B12-binding domain-containing radical SAM protein [Spirulina subsalsa]|uniref:B12-binding domain-containing radical SAM protein n=1 Tax=Spirulina subsalsa TaxID=54311 RepID=UPI0002DDAAB2|nr:radical SAM protein [Spirulina subsalsa]
MKVLLVYPIFPKSFWSFERTIQLIGRKTFLPPLGLITVAALLPQHWELKLVDRNVRDIREDEWEWADLIMLSGMIVQKPDLLEQIREAKRRGKLVAAGGPYPTSIPQDCQGAGIDFLILDEGEITIPLFIEAVERGETSGVFRSNGEKPDVTGTPIPRYDLLEMNAYAVMSVQFSRGCPFQCEFCDIIVLYGRKPRTKTPEQLLAELQYLYDLGWRDTVFVVDDNFIGNKRNVKLLLKALQPWMEEHRYPFPFNTEASVDLAQDQELMDMMVACNFGSVFLGIETPDEDSLAVTKKFQNTRSPLSESVYKITSSGLRIMAGFIIGFDGEKPGAGQRIVQFVQESGIPVAIYSMLQALPDTALWFRLQKEGRLLGASADLNQSTLMNFIPTRPIEEIAREYIDTFWQLYDPEMFLERTHRCYRILATANFPEKKREPKKVRLDIVKGLLTVLWNQGVVRPTRWKFWPYLFDIMRCNPGGVMSYLSVCAYIEHFADYRHIVKAQIEEQLAAFVAQKEQQEQAKPQETVSETVALS